MPRQQVLEVARQAQRLGAQARHVRLREDGQRGQQRGQVEHRRVRQLVARCAGHGDEVWRGEGKKKGKGRVLVFL
jgi:hypothetical protein